MSDFPKTKAAILEWESSKPLRDRKWDAVKTNADVASCEALDREATLRVGEAFFDETREFNGAWVARYVHPADPWLRRLAGLSAVA